MRLLLLLSIVFVSATTSIAQPILLNEISMGMGIETFHSTIPTGKTINTGYKDGFYGIGASFNFGAPLVTAILNFGDETYWKIGDYYFLDTWTMQASFGASTPLAFYITGIGDYGFGFKNSLDHQGFGMILGARVFFNSIGPGSISPMLGLSYWGIQGKAGATFSELGYVYDESREYPYSMIGFRVQKVTADFLTSGKGSEGGYASIFWNYSF